MKKKKKRNKKKKKKMQEVVARSCSTFYQKDFLKITQNLQKNTCPRVS